MENVQTKCIPYLPGKLKKNCAAINKKVTIVSKHTLSKYPYSLS